MKRKLTEQQGVTLVEMLCAVAVLILLGLMLNTGIQMVVRSYRGMIAEEEVELLLSTAADALADDLRYARDVQHSGGALSSYRSDSFGADTVLTLDGGQIMANGKRLLPPGAYRKGRYVIDRMEIGYDGACFTIKLHVQDAGGEHSAETEFSVRCLNGADAAGGGP